MIITRTSFQLYTYELTAFLYCLDSSWCENPNPCLNGNCTDVGENFTCSCEDGFEGERCEIGENYWAGLTVDFISHLKLLKQKTCMVFL